MWSSKVIHYHCEVVLEYRANFKPKHGESTKEYSLSLGRKKSCQFKKVLEFILNEKQFKSSSSATLAGMRPDFNLPHFRFCPNLASSGSFKFIFAKPSALRD